MSISRDRKEVEKLADELFSDVQRSQGFAFISDGWSGGNTKAEFIKWAEDRLYWNREASKVILKFLRKHKRS